MTIKKSKKKDTEILPVEMPNEMHQQLKWLSFKTNLSMAELCRRGAEHIIKEYSKKYPLPKP